VCCSVLQCVAVCCSVLHSSRCCKENIRYVYVDIVKYMYLHVLLAMSLFKGKQCVTVCCSVLHSSKYYKESIRRKFSKICSTVVVRSQFNSKLIFENFYQGAVTQVWGGISQMSALQSFYRVNIVPSWLFRISIEMLQGKHQEEFLKSQLAAKFTIDKVGRAPFWEFSQTRGYGAITRTHIYMCTIYI